MNKQKMICNGEFVAPHGVRGEIRLYPYSDQPEQYLSQRSFLLEDGRKLAVTDIRSHKRVYVVKIAGIDSVEAAETLRGEKIYTLREDLPPLPEGEYFHIDLIGLEAIHGETEESLGEIINVISTGANDVLVVRSPNEKEILYPFIREVIQKVDLPEGRIVLLPQKEWS